MEPIRIRFGGYQPPASVHSRGAAVLGRALAGRLGDRVRFDLDGDIVAAGRPAADLLGLVERGELTMCYFATSYLAHRVPDLAALDLPFLLDRRERASALLDGALGAYLAERVEAATGYRVLGYWDNGFRHLTNRVRPLRGPGDCRGLRIRTLASELHHVELLHAHLDRTREIEERFHHAIQTRDLAADHVDGALHIALFGHARPQDLQVQRDGVERAARYVCD